MILAHLSDLHLGYRAYERLDRGRNVRERDVALAFERAVQDLVRLRPDVVLVAGDVFDRPDPPSSALLTLARGLETLRTSLPAAHVLMIAGARDTPRSTGEPGVLALLDTLPRVHATTSAERSLLLEELSLHVLLLPHASLQRAARPTVEPDPRARHHVVVAYARVETSRGLGLDPADWDYVALGHEHSQRSVAPGVAYCGSLERVGPEPWAEAAEEKGFLSVELPSGRVSFHPVPGRAVVALAPIKVSPDAEAMRKRIREVTEEVPGGIDDKIVRMRLQGIGRRELVLLQGDLLSSLRARALHLVVEVEPLRAPSAPEELLPRVERELAQRGGGSAERLERVRRLLGSAGARAT